MWIDGSCDEPGTAVLSQARRGRKENEHECCWDYVLFTFTTFTSTYFIGFFFFYYFNYYIDDTDDTEQMI